MSLMVELDVTIYCFLKSVIMEKKKICFSKMLGPNLSPNCAITLACSRQKFIYSISKKIQTRDVTKDDVPYSLWRCVSSKQ